MGAAPVITDGDVTLAESGAIMGYILAKYGNGRLAVGPNAVKSQKQRQTGEPGVGLFGRRWNCVHEPVRL